MRLLLLATVLAGLPLAACSSESAAGGAGGGGGAGAGRPAVAEVVEDLQGRSYTVKVSPTHDKATPAPLVVMLHGFTDDPNAPESMDAYFGMSAETMARGMILALPLGTYDAALARYEWNGTDTCCGFTTPKANDIGYIHAMITAIEAEYAVDTKRVFVVGHSNGGFMANRLACDTAGRFAGIVSLAGMPFKNPTKCNPSAAIAMLHVHGDADDTVLFDGGPPYGIESLPDAPGAEEAFAMWQGKNRCTGAVDTSGAPLDLVTDLAGAETHPSVASGCEANGATELWVIEGGPHSPAFNDSWSATILDFLMAHPKP